MKKLTKVQLQSLKKPKRSEAFKEYIEKNIEQYKEEMMEVIKIDWKGSFTIDKILQGNELLFSEIGVYQIYGFHPLYGNDVLLYIGRTKNENGFSSRLKNRWEILNGQDSENVRIYLGVPFSDEKTLQRDEKEKMIEKAEVLMINSLKPAFNSSNVKNVGKNLLQEYIVENYGQYRKLYPIFSSHHSWFNFKNYKILYEDLKHFFQENQGENTKNPDGFYIEGQKIWIGIDEAFWDEYEIPLQIAICKKSINKEDLKKVDQKIIDNYKEDKDYYYIEACEDLDKFDENLLKEKIKEIKKYL